ncbi:MAG: hypothetical protein ACI9YU_000623 [Flavobacteriales bacterium]|jgi:hypothetical protein
MDFGFLLYDSRSGSTLLSALLNQYEGIHVSHEIKYVTQILDYPTEIESADDLEELLDHLFAFVQMKEAGIDRSALRKSLQAPMDKRALIEEVIGFHFRNHSNEFCLIKHAPIRYMDRLKELFPELKYVHIVRDIRGVHASKKKTISTYGRPMSTNVIKSARYWNQKMQRILMAKAPVHHVRYEDLLTDEEKTLNEVLALLGFNAPVRSGSVSDYSERIGGSQSSLHSNLAKGVLTSKAESWKKELTPNEIRSLERDCETMLGKWGYAPTKTKGTAVYPIFILNECLVFAAELFGNAAKSVFKGNFATRLNYFLGKGK